YPIVHLQQRLGDPFVGATSWVAGRAVDFLRLPYTVAADNPSAFTSTHLPAEQNYTLVIGQLCSGTSVLIGFALLGTGLARLMRGPMSRRLRWLALGLVLAFISNLVRVAALLTVASRASYDVALNVVHPA